MPTKENILIHVLRRDLRLDDNPVFHEIAQLYLSGKARFTHVLPLYIFNARQIEVSGFFTNSGSEPLYPEAKSLIGKFWRCGPHRARFLCESVWDLKQTLENVNSGLCIRAGNLQDVVQSALESLGSDGSEAEIVGVWMTGDVTPEELEDEASIQTVVEAKGMEFRLFKDEKYFIDE
jgi:deoxyribodipyrimidine photo-lyase